MALAIRGPTICPKHSRPLVAIGEIFLCPRKDCIWVRHPFEPDVWITAAKRRRLLKVREKDGRKK
ncbi:MAG: hypothetical protein NTW79_00380 [Candidatus Berkelbacteria bacterium]|nr:hypothetical protein [Candidatus Berkelbacteria bacterium]